MQQSSPVRMKHKTTRTPQQTNYFHDHKMYNLLRPYLAEVFIYSNKQPILEMLFSKTNPLSIMVSLVKYFTPNGLNLQPLKNNDALKLRCSKNWLHFPQCCKQATVFLLSVHLCFSNMCLVPLCVQLTYCRQREHSRNGG